MHAWNGRAIFGSHPDLVIESDASGLGWGARCGEVSTGGKWSSAEQTLHINCLELMAGSFAVKCWTRESAELCPPQDGQCSSGALHESLRRDTFQGAVEHGPRLMGILPLQQHLYRRSTFRGLPTKWRIGARAIGRTPAFGNYTRQCSKNSSLVGVLSWWTSLHPAWMLS